MPNPWKEPKALAKLLDMSPGDAREVIRENPNALQDARAAKRNGKSPKTILSATNGEKADEGKKARPASLDGLKKVQAVKTLYDKYEVGDIEAITACIEKVGGLREFRKTKDTLDSLQFS